MEDVAKSLCQIIKDEIDFPKPKLRVKKRTRVVEKTGSETI